MAAPQGQSVSVVIADLHRLSDLSWQESWRQMAVDVAQLLEVLYTLLPIVVCWLWTQVFPMWSQDGC